MQDTHNTLDSSASSVVGGVAVSEGQWEGNVRISPCWCILCRMAIKTFQMPPHSPSFTFDDTKYIPKGTEQ